MAKKKIKLPLGEWTYDDAALLGPPGGFGEVFRGTGPAGNVAVKRLKLTASQAAHRELRIGEELIQRQLQHVVPILDAGQDAQSDRYFLVMPVCDQSLQDEIDGAKGGLNVNVTSAAISAIISGLTEVGDITHRDLKPANILLHEGIWKIADFGIAKFVEDSTSFETLRGSLTPAYAAPEQWYGERPSSATDVYALGCIIHALTTGEPPFSGSLDEIRAAHLHDTPATIAVLPPRIATFVTQMLRKTPAARPTLKRCQSVLADIKLEQKSAAPARHELLRAAQYVAEREAAADAAAHAAATYKRERQALFEEARRSLTEIRDRLFQAISDISENVTRHPDAIQFGHARLTISDSNLLSSALTTTSTSGPARNRTSWDLLGWGTIRLRCELPEQDTYNWSASLCFANRADDHGFRWHEVAFWSLNSRSRDVPFAIEGHSQDLNLALSPVMHVFQIAYGPFPIDGEDEDAFIDRWIGLVARAAQGKLRPPSSMPIRDFDRL